MLWVRKRLYIFYDKEPIVPDYFNRHKPMYSIFKKDLFGSLLLKG